MIKRISCALLILGMMAILTGCVNRYVVKENWIDEQDVLYIVANPSVNSFAKLGNPVLVFMLNDTLKYIYHYSPSLYESKIYRGHRYNKPDDSNRMEGRWGRKEMLEFSVYRGAVVKINQVDEYKITTKSNANSVRAK